MPDDTAAPDACPHVDNCPLFPLFRQGSNLEVWKTIYCHGAFDTCERHKLSAEGRAVPINLLPNGDQLPTP